MNRTNALTIVVLLASIVVLFVGCGGEEAPSYLKDPNSAPPISADALSESQAEQNAVADAEKSEAARSAPAKGKAKR